ncbi:MAG: glycosyltransferase family 2 protein [Alphaproteobacteria bacterium]|nr:glycosyltransferase family 2 protein [Alphaproteobacteria bacterium]
MAEISVVIPVYQAENILQVLHDRLKKSLESITEDYEIIFIDDGSKDKSWDLIEDISKSNQRVRGIRFCRNFGQHCAITAGLDRCDGNYVVVMDCDLQDPPEEIPRLYKKIKEGYPVVLAIRKERKDSYMKILYSYLFYKTLSILSGLKFNSELGNFRMVSRKVVDNFRLMQDQIRFFISLMEWMGFPSTSIEIKHAERLHGKSNYNFKKSWDLALNVIIANSERPLKASIVLGVTISLLSFFFSCYIICKSIYYKTYILGWSSLIVATMFIGGVIIMNIGLLGIYINKIFEQVKRRPHYISLLEVGFNKSNQSNDCFPMKVKQNV